MHEYANGGCVSRACNLPCIQTFQMHDTWTFRGVPYMEDTYIHLTWYAWRDSPIWRAILFSRMIMRAVAVFVRRYESRRRAISSESHYERMKRIAQKYFLLAAILEIVHRKKINLKSRLRERYSHISKNIIVFLRKKSYSRFDWICIDANITFAQEYLHQYKFNQIETKIFLKRLQYSQIFIDASYFCLRQYKFS